MTGDKRDLLDVLSAELAFSESGGYRHSEGDAWRPQFIFQDSPTCLEFNQNRPSTQCANCILTKLAPHNLRSKKTPCRYIPLNENGETLDSLYRSNSQEETEFVVQKWLKTKVAQLERERADMTNASKHSGRQPRAKRVTSRELPI